MTHGTAAGGRNGAPLDAFRPSDHGALALEVRRLRSLQASGVGFYHSFYRPGLLHPAHWHETWTVCLVLAGSLDEQREEDGGRVGALQAIVRPPRAWHLDRFEGARTMTLAFDPAWAARVGRELRPLGRSFVLDSPRLATNLLRVQAEVARGQELRRTAAVLLGPIAHELEAVSRRCARPLPPGHWLQRVLADLARPRGWRTPLAELARAVGKHPTHVSASFHRWMGRTLGAFRAEARVREACVRLAAGETSSLTELALRLGFADHSHLCRVFRAHTGTSPSRFRKLASLSTGGEP